jgi:hypothetical protein
MRRAHKPATTRSQTRRLGERCRERFRTRSCCLTRTDSATTKRAPPGPASRAIVVMRWMKSTARTRMTEHRNRSRNPRHAPKLAIRHRHAAEGSAAQNVSRGIRTLLKHNRSRTLCACRCSRTNNSLAGIAFEKRAFPQQERHAGGAVGAVSFDSNSRRTPLIASGLRSRSKIVS